MPIDAYLLDTSIASAAWDKGHQLHEFVRSKMAALGAAPFYVCPITLAEVEYGLQLARTIDTERQRAMRQAMAHFDILPIDKHTTPIYGEIRAKLFLQHAPRHQRTLPKVSYVEDLIDLTTGKSLGIQENDLWLISVAVQYDARFVTRDRAGGMRRILDAAGHTARTDFWCMP